MKTHFLKMFVVCSTLCALAAPAMAQTATTLPVVTVYAVDANASEAGPDTGTFLVRRAGNTNNSITVFMAFTGTASNGVDYELLPNTVSIPAGTFSVPVTVTPIADDLMEGSESVVLTLTPSPMAVVPQYQIGLPNSAVVTIYDLPRTNTQPVVNIFATDPDATEIPEVPPGMGLVQRVDPAIFTVTRSGPTGFPMTVFYHIGGTASNGVDYVKLPDSVIIPEGAREAQIEVDPIDDFIVEPTETVVLTLQPPICAAIFPPPPDCYVVGVNSRAIAYIHDNDLSTSNLPPYVNIFTPADGAVFVAPANILIAANAMDRDDTVSTVEFFEGTNSLGVRTNLPVANPLGPFLLTWTNVSEGKYVLTALATDSRGATSLSAPVHVAVVASNAPPTNLPPLVGIVATDPIAAEGTNYWRWPVATSDGTWLTNTSPTALLGTNPPGPNIAVFKIRRTGETNSDLTVYYSIGGTASNGVDYETLPGTITIPAGQHAARILVVPIDDDLVEPIETVILKLEPPPDPTAGLTAPSYRIGFPARAAAIIVDNDSPRPPCMTLSDGLFHLCEPGTNGFGFCLQASADLFNWTILCTNRVADGALHFVDPDAAGQGIRFYRALPEPTAPTD